MTRGIVRTSAPTLANGTIERTTLDANGYLKANVSAGSGGAVTIADGADVAEGAKADAAWTSGDGTVVSVLKAIDRDVLLPLAAGTNIVGKVGIDQTTPGTTNLVAAGQSGTWTVQPGNTANTTPWLTSITQGGNTATVTNGGAADGLGLSAQGLLAFTVAGVYNGASWDRQRGDVNGTVVQPALSSTFWNYAAASGGISNTTTAVTVKAAAGASVRNYIKSLQLTADALGAATEFAIRDGAGGTVLARIKLNTGGIAASGTTIFDPPLRGTANTLVEVVTLTATVTGAVYANLQGYTGI